MLQGFQKKAGVRHAAASGQMSMWQMGTIIQTPTIREAIVGHRHMGTWSLLGLLGSFSLAFMEKEGPALSRVALLSLP